MAIAYVLLAGLVGTLVAGYAWLTGHVGLIGAVGLYVSAGWAAIIAGVLVAGFAKLIERPSSFDRRTDDAEVVMLPGRRPTKSQQLPRSWEAH